MAIDIIVNNTGNETRVAFIENNEVERILIERDSTDKELVGNIYKGKVVKVLPGMQACFVDIGLEKAAFLYVDDVNPHAKRFYSSDYDTNGDDYNNVRSKNIKISDLVKEGNEILVQILKPSLGSKGPRVTTHVSIPGRFLVFMPTVSHIGVSRKIADEKERERLRKLIQELKSKSGGYILRTLAEGVSRKEIKNDVQFLTKSWDKIKSKSGKIKIGELIYQELDLPLKVVRDHFSEETQKLVVDKKEIYYKIKKFVETFSPKLKNKIVLHIKEEPIFDTFNVESTISKALSKRVWLKSGGYIIIDETEALVAIDVNSGRYVGKKNLEETILKINLEAAKEIAYQIMLRNIGGIIIIDFIDMDSLTNRDKVYEALALEFNNDKAKTNFLKISELGLVQMTRQRMSNSITKVLCDPCPYCDGKGYVKSLGTVSFELLRQIDREMKNVSPGDHLILYVNLELKKYVEGTLRREINKIEMEKKVKISLEENDKFKVDHFEIFQKLKTSFEDESSGIS